jgi:hypothetical protein
MPQITRDWDGLVNYLKLDLLALLDGVMESIIGLKWVSKSKK